jgi:hypothetical protein
MVMVNLPIAGVDYHVPFGGRKGSSFGAREQGRYAAEFYTTVKTAYTLPYGVASVFRDRKREARLRARCLGHHVLTASVEERSRWPGQARP